jgi:hypothetical protein
MHWSTRALIRPIVPLRRALVKCLDADVFPELRAAASTKPHSEGIVIFEQSVRRDKPPYFNTDRMSGERDAPK